MSVVIDASATPLSDEDSRISRQMTLDSVLRVKDRAVVFFLGP